MYQKNHRWAGRILLATGISLGILFSGASALADTVTVIPLTQIQPITLCDMKIKAAGIPIDGISGWPVKRIDFKEQTTDAQKQQAWDIINTFDYQTEFVAYQAAVPANTAPIATNFSTSAPSFTQDGQISVAEVNGYPYIYFQANGVTQHILGASSFEISAHETTDAISGEKMQVGDFVIGMIDKNLNNGDTPENSSMHGIWVKWSSVKKQLIQELKDSGEIGQGGVAGVSSSGIIDTLAGLGIAIKDGITHIASLAVDKFTASTASVDNLTVKKLQMTDQVTGQIYCTWIENGQWQKSQGECGGAAPKVEVPTPPAAAPVEPVDSSPEESAPPAQEAAPSIAPEMPEAPAETPVVAPNTTPASDTGDGQATTSAP